jgi:hypothetical protein
MNQAAIQGGDHRGGFMGMSSRADSVANAQRERTHLLALELQDKVRAGVLSQEEADAEADKILGSLR